MEYDVLLLQLGDFDSLQQLQVRFLKDSLCLGEPAGLSLIHI